MVLLYNTIFHREGSSVWYCCIILYFIEKAVVCGIVL